MRAGCAGSGVSGVRAQIHPLAGSREKLPLEVPALFDSFETIGDTAFDDRKAVHAVSLAGHCPESVAGRVRKGRRIPSQERYELLNRQSRLLDDCSESPHRQIPGVHRHGYRSTGCAVEHRDMAARLPGADESGSFQGGNNLTRFQRREFRRSEAPRAGPA